MNVDASLPYIDPRCASLPFRLICFNLGKADAFLITTPHSAVLIDTGSKARGKQLAQQLAALGVDRLDFLIVTHFDADHIGGVSQLMKSIQVDQLLQSPIFSRSRDSLQYRSVLKKNGMRPDSVYSTEQFSLDGVSYTIFPPQRKHYPRDQRNNASLLVHVRHGNNTFLFTADAREARLIEFLSTHPGHCDLLKAPHHGHYQKILPDLVQAVSPRFAVITSDDDHREDPQTLELLYRAGCRVALTRLGTAVCFSNEEELFLFQ